MNNELFDVVIYPYGQQTEYDPRRICFDDYQIEWHRQGLQFVHCPKGMVHNQNNLCEDFSIASGDIIPWSQLINRERYDIVPNEGKTLYSFRAFWRTLVDWERCCEIPNNINAEVMWQLAQIEEWKWSPQMSQRDIKDTLYRLKDCMPMDISDECDRVRDIVLNTWQKRWTERLSHDIMSPNQDVQSQISAAISSFKRLIYNSPQSLSF